MEADKMGELIEAWRKRHGISSEALRELWQLSLYLSDENPELPEARVQAEVRLEAARKGYYLYRNNRGAGKLENGNFTRWGLANDSKKLGDSWKSGDLIGWRPYYCYTETRGWHTAAQFVSVEVKRGDWKFSGSIEEVSQARWATLINELGGYAVIVNAPGHL
jgi:hypothetical protein